MKRRTLGAMTVACLLALHGCGGGSAVRQDPLADVAWSYATDAVILRIAAASRLNEYDGQAHTLLLGIYETADAQAFRDLAANPAALAASMTGGKLPTAFIQFSRYVIEPGQQSYLVLDRAQNTRSLGIVAGYARLDARNAVRQFDIPLLTTTRGWVFKDSTIGPASLVARLDFGPQSIVNSQPLASGPSPAELQQARLLEGGGKEIRLGDTPQPPLRKLGGQAASPTQSE